MMTFTSSFNNKKFINTTLLFDGEKFHTWKERIKLFASTKNLILAFHNSKLSPSNDGCVFMKRHLLKIDVFQSSIYLLRQLFL